jgi:hypothetical protein
MDGIRWFLSFVVAVTALIIGWMAWQHPKIPRTASPSLSGAPAGIVPSSASQPSAVRTLDYDQLQVGDCLTGSNLANVINTSNYTWPDSTQAVPCNEPHIAEVFFIDNSYWASGESFPGSTTLDNKAVAVCRNAFKSYLGISYDDSIYSFGYTDPDSATWPEGDRGLHCVAYYVISGQSNVTVLHKSVKGVDS